MANQRVPGPYNQVQRPVVVTDGTSNLVPSPTPGPSGDPQTRQGSEGRYGHRIDDRVNDTNFLLCLVLCYIGLPPQLWRTLVSFVLEAVSSEYRERRGDAVGSREFAAFKTEFQAWDIFTKVKNIIAFLGEG